MASGDGDKGYSPSAWVMGIIAGLILVVTAWYLNMTEAKNDRMDAKLDAVLSAQSDFSSAQTGIQRDLEWLKIGMSDIFTTKEAEQEHATIKRTTDDLYDKYRNLDARMSTVEKEQRQ